MSKQKTACNLEFVREDDYVEYYIFPQLPDNLTGDDQQLEQLRQHLEHIRMKCLTIVNRHVKKLEYIWHKDEFQLLVRSGTAKERLLDDEHDKKHHTQAVALPPHLHGVTHYGENIADEWYIVHLLFELSRELPDIIARVIDADGEFMLIEAADVLPKWANPDTCQQRVYIFEGILQLVQNSPSQTSSILAVGSALSKIRLNPSLYRVPKDIQKCINARIKEFRHPPSITERNTSIHRQIVRLPVGVAALLKQRPSLIAPAVRAFCERDQADVKTCQAMRFFPPEQRVRANVRFTRCLYAMIMHSKYFPDRKTGWNLCCNPLSEKYKEDLVGIKIACGFEILASRAKEAHNEENEPAWRAYVKSLQSKGYFRDNIEGSQEYQQLYREAREYYTKNNERFRTAPIIGREILDLLNDTEINIERFRDEEQNSLQLSDSDNWLHISPEQLDSMLNERYGVKKIYRSNGPVNAEEFTKHIAAFFEKQSDFEGIDNKRDMDHDDEEKTDQASSSSKQQRAVNNLKKNRSMRKACNENPVIQKLEKKDTSSSDNLSTHVKNLLDFVIPEDKWDSNSDMSDYEGEEDLERNIEEEMTNSERNIDPDIETYMAQMDKELAKTTIGQTFEKQSKKSTGDDFDDIESFQPIDINVNTLKNMMDSYKSQVGGAGPASNLLSAMGIGMSNTTDDEKDLTESGV